MALQEADREDLMKEAVALIRRVEWQLPDNTIVTAGIKANGDWSVYFDSDPVYHFDAQHGLRRAFVAGRLYRSQGTTLSALTRHRTPTTTELERHDLTPEELTNFLSNLQTRLESLHSVLVTKQVTTIRQVPLNDSLQAELEQSLHAVLRNTHLAPSIKQNIRREP